MADISKITLPNGDVYNFKDSTARSSIPSAATASPKMDGTAAVGTSKKYAKEDHVHPSDTSKLDANLGSANSGKFLIVGSTGAIEAVTMTEWQGGSY